MAETRKKCPVCDGTGVMRLCFGDRLIAVRQEKGWTQGELSEYMGISRPQIANLECSRGQPTTAVLIAAARALGVSTDFLLGLAEDK